MNAIDLFSGAGGFSKGFEKQGYNIIAANELNHEIAETYKYNHRNTIMINKPIEEFSENPFEMILNNTDQNNEEIKEKLKKISIIIGGPPCQGFSMAGARIRKNNSEKDIRNYLFEYYFKVIKAFKPDYFIMENVEGLKSYNDGEIFEKIKNIKIDDKNNYYISHKVISADDFGVPQSRKRLIIIGTKFDNFDFDLFLKKAKEEMLKEDNRRFDRVSIEDAISDLNYLSSNEGEFKQEYKYLSQSYYQQNRRKNSKYLYNHKATKHSEIALNRIKQIKRKENWQNLSETIKSVHSGSYGRLCWKDTANTITTRFDTPSGGRFIHPEQNRTLTPREAARIQSFDDDFIFLGKKTSINTQIGNAVPPLVAEVLAKMIKLHNIEQKNS